MAEKTRKRRPVLLYLLGGLGVILLLLVAFYQPILFSLTGFVAQRAAGAAKIALSYRAHGTIFSNLTLEDVSVSPLPENKDFAVERLRAKTVALQYDLPAVFHKDWAHAIKLVRLKDADVVIRQTPPQPKQPRRGPIKFPGVIPEVIDIDGLNLTVREDAGDLQARNLFVHLRQNQPGDLGWQALTIPGVGHWEDVHAGLAERDGVLELTDLHLPPLVDVQRLALDVRRSADGIFGADLKATALNAPVALHAMVSQSVTGEPSDVALEVGRLDLENLKAVLKLPVQGIVTGTEARLRGDLAHPDTWGGLLRTRLENLKYQEYEAQSVVLDARFDQGAGSIQQLSVRSGRNAVQVAGAFGLPHESSRFVQELQLNLGLAVMAPQPELYVPEVHGALLLTGSAGLQAGNWNARLETTVRDLATRGLAVPGTLAQVFATGRLPLGPTVWTSFAAIVLADVRDAGFEPVRVPSLTAEVVLPGQGVAQVQATVRAAESRVDVKAEAPLPVGGAAFDPKRVDAELNLAVPSLADFLTKKLYAGELRVRGHVILHDLKPDGSVELHGSQITYQAATVQAVDASVQLRGEEVVVTPAHIRLDGDNYVDLNGKARLTAPYPYQAFGQAMFSKLENFNPLLKAFNQPEGVTGTLEVTFSGQGDLDHAGGHLEATGNGLRYRGVTVQTLQVGSDLADNQVKLRTCHLVFDPDNAVNLSGTVQVKEPRPFDLSVQADLKNLSAFNAALREFGQAGDLSGGLGVRASAKGNASDPLGSAADLTLNGRQVKYRGLVVGSVDLQAGLVDRKVNVPSARIVFDPKDTVDVRGSARLSEPYPYDADATVAFQDLGFLNGLVASFGQNRAIGGKVDLKWNGRGELRNSTGTVELHGANLRAAPVQDVKVDVTANYQGLNVDVPKVQVSSPYADLNAAVRVNPQQFEIPNLTLTKGGNAVTGRVRIPLDLRADAKVPVNLDQPMDVDLRATNVSLASFQGDKPQVTGNIGVQLQASKTLRDPFLQFTTTVRDVRSPAVSALSAASSDILIRLADKVLTLQGRVEQADIQPIQMQGRIPVDVGQVIGTGRLPDNTSLQFALKWPETNLAFVDKVVPMFRRIEGRAGADVNVGGTLKKPVISGAVTADIPRLQAKADLIPPISNFVTRINLQQDRVQVAQLQGLAGGGAFRVNGLVDLADGTNPKFDLTANGNQVLFLRNDRMIVRANFDLAIRGPLSTGEVTGAVGLVDSRFFQDIDILPLNLPGRPAPKPASVPPPSQVSITTPPLRDWKFDIKVRTERPFLVQSNLARGRVTVDLQVGGTGLQPTVTGFVRIDQLTASLPVSHLDITNGFVTFVPGGNPLDPSLNIVGASTIRDYDVRVRVFGNVSNFQILFDSTPPLSQGDIATLLATGATTSEFTENPSLLAGNASFILAQQLLTKIFRFRPNAQQQSFMERLQVNIIPGSRPGTQDVSARFSLTKNYQLIGEVGQEGDVGVRLRYLIRFR
ncbi:MAG: translocation/assembly module TamB domain-containing protein [Verrucomicrobia bacterium]|nr:translocation/assembly module TamB domain-containing protein [Verrucomicrobiota bacterium]